MTTQPEVASGDDNLKWIQTHPDELEAYQGKWIAVYDRQIIFAAADGEVVIDYLGEQKINGAFLYEVPEDVHSKVYLIA
jgi:hypothetical protein